MQKTCTKRKIEYIESNTVELGSRNGFLFTNWLGRCKSKCCLILYGSCHVQGNALFMDYSISQKANVWPHVISVLSSFDERCIVYSFFPPLSWVCVFFVDATEKMETSFFPASVCMSHFQRWIHVWTNHRAMWECVVSAFVCAFECSYLICIMGVWHHCYSDTRHTCTYYVLGIGDSVQSELMWAKCVCVCGFHNGKYSKLNVRFIAVQLFMVCDLINI